MKILLLGGPRFLGYHLIEAARAAGHTLTLFNRGTTAANLFPELERIKGDRDGGLAALSGRRWDVVIDTSGYIPRLVGDSARLLAGAVDRYVFISTISVYSDLRATPLDETAPVGRLDDPTVEEISGGSYGPLKVLCEEAVEAALPGRALLLRPGLIVGPLDPTDRFTWWPVRTARGGEMLCPGSPEVPVQMIDVRDLAGWTLRQVEAGTTGLFNATGPATPLRLGEVIEACRSITSADARPVWVDEPFLLAQGVQPWIEMPLWVPAEDQPLMRVDCGRALTRGLAFRPLAGTIRDTLAWHATRPPGTDLKAGLPPEREAAVLSAWKNRAPVG